MSITTIIFIVLLVDAISANIVFYFGRNWYIRHFRIFSRFFPPEKGWSMWYLVLVLYIGYLSI
ncbi:hypothetical protein KC842_02370 [Candidatus Nomurabacteria bacterium]|nr:hypothetical protein [Candidatus Nomurabacteria bacterium]USN95112.1 MAG: hypothetical protein H6791_01655 [Candidatus Nomurabacteria bacterium]